MTDAQTRFLRLSASSARILGYRPEELHGRKFLDLAHPNDLQATLLAHESVLRGAQASNSRIAMFAKMARRSS